MESISHWPLMPRETWFWILLLDSTFETFYGHENDGYSNPKLAWSCYGQYILGNTEPDSSLCVWDIASSQLVHRNGQAHGHTIRDMYASPNTDLHVTTSFDKKSLLWFGPS
jgi:WD40 repeat protein